MKKGLLIFTAILMMAGGLAGCAERREESDIKIKEAAAAAEKTIEWYKNTDIKSFFVTAALLDAGQSLSDSRVAAVKGLFDIALNPTTLAHGIYALAQRGENPRDYGGRDLVKELAEMQAEDGSWGNIYETVYAVVTLENFDAGYKRDAAIDYIFKLQLKNGAFYTGAEEKKEDTELTAMAVCALKSLGENGDIKSARKKAMEYLWSIQLESGGFPSYGIETARTTAMVLMAAADAGETGNSTGFAKAFYRLLEHQTEDGRFISTEGASEADANATSYGLAALTAVEKGRSLWRSLAVK